MRRGSGLRLPRLRRDDYLRERCTMIRELIRYLYFRMFKNRTSGIRQFTAGERIEKNTFVFLKSDGKVYTATQEKGSHEDL